MKTITILWIIFFGLLASLTWQLASTIFKSKIIMITKDNSFRVISKKPAKGSAKIKIGEGIYNLSPEAVIPDRGFMFWRKWYVFDEGNPNPRIIQYDKNYKWVSAEGVLRIINDEHIKAMTQQVITPQIKLFIIMGALGGLLACLTSGVLLLIQLGIIKG